ncbi:uncharacterized protein LOC100903998 [Galendromus occidentalis]|uniref:Uncharacterized protein LOC100903998 n=1 Tax=Galendromus occidentalis TaxID=34638 RepID=A0AAJ6QW97_9ACAR|nr:uncharacterized protein LOC100903998 [Galendromus occidentalis]
MRFDTFHGPVDIPGFVIYVVWAMVTIFNLSLVVFLWPYRKRTLVKLFMSLLCADLIQAMISIVEAVGINAMREYNWWCSVSVSVEEASWTIAGYSLLLITLEIFFRSTWRRGSKRRSIRGKAGIVLLVLWFLSFIINSLTIPFYKNVCNAHTMDELYSIVYKISLASMNLLIPLAWTFLLLVKTSHNLETNLHIHDEWSKDLTVILVINFTVCWIVKQLPTIVFWDYRQVYIVVDNLSYVLSNIRCLVDAMMIILFFNEITSLGTCECGGELTKQLPGHQHTTRTRTPPPIADVNDL